MDSAADRLLRERVQRAFDLGDDADWQDVVRRARTQKRRRSRPLVAVAFAATAAVAALVVPGPGLGYLRGLFAGDPAPPGVKDVIAGANRGAPANLAPQIEADKTHKLIQIQMSDGRTATLWVAPSKSGGVCSYVQRGHRLSGGAGCRGETLPASAPIDWLLQGGTQDDRVVLVSGSVSDRVRDLRVAYDDGTAETLELNQGFFLFEIPSQRLQPGRQPTSLVGYDGNGAEVGRVALGGVGIYPSSP
jgi:hypothetical protein